MVKPPGVFPERFVRAVGEGSQAGAPKWWSYQLRGCCRRGFGITPLEPHQVLTRVKVKVKVSFPIV